MHPIALSIALASSLATLNAHADLKLHWATLAVDTTGRIGPYSKPAFNKKGELKVGYRGQYDVRYAEFKNGGLWNTVVADTTATGSAAKLDFVLDSDDQPHILFQNWSYRKQYYTAFDGKEWKHRDLDHINHGALDFYQLAMEADSKGGVYMVYSKDRGPGNISALYGTRIDRDGNLSDTGFIQPGNFGKWVSMTMDSKDEPVVAFFRHAGETLELAWKEGGVWQLDTVGKSLTPQPQGYHVSIARASDTLYHITYIDKLKKELWMASGKPSGTWKTEKIDNLGPFGFTMFNSQTSLGLGKDGIPFVAYARLNSTDGQTVDASRLMLAYKQDTTWTHVGVDTMGIVGEYAALAISPEGTPIITYFDRTKNHLKVAISSFGPITSNRPKKIRSPLKGAKPAPHFDASGRKAVPAAPKGRESGSPAKILFRQP